MLCVCVVGGLAWREAGIYVHMHASIINTKYGTVYRNVLFSACARYYLYVHTVYDERIKY